MIKVKLKKWGNSFGIIIPKDIVDSENLKEDQEVEIMIVKNNKNILRESFGTLKRNGNKTTEQEMR